LFVLEPWRERRGSDSVSAGDGGFFCRSDGVNREVRVLIPVAVFDRRLAETGHGRGVGRCQLTPMSDRVMVRAGTHLANALQVVDGHDPSRLLVPGVARAIHSCAGNAATSFWPRHHLSFAVLILTEQPRGCNTSVDAAMTLVRPDRPTRLGVRSGSGHGVDVAGG
jgi:hypothetical protein